MNDDCFSLSNRGAELCTQGKYKEGEEYLRQALDLNPNIPGINFNLGNILFKQRRYEEALEFYLIAYNITNECKLKISIGNTLRYLKRDREALAWFDQAYKQFPDNDEYRKIVTLTKLSLGDFSSKLIDEKIYSSYLLNNIPLWNNEPLHNNPILLWADQGFGDAIMFSRYASIVKDLGGRPAICCSPLLLKILSTISGVECTIPIGSIIEYNDSCQSYQALLSNLPTILGTTLKTIPSKVPYITPDSKLVNYWKNKLINDKYKIGITWQGSPENTQDKSRSIPLNKFEKISNIPGVCLYSLQKGFGSEQLTIAKFPIIDLGHEINDFMDTAAIIQNLDLVISVDTAVSHLSGALARPTWTLIRYIADWRWFQNQTNTEWYPTMSLIRQKQWDDWDSVFNKVEIELYKIIQKPNLNQQ